MSLVGILPATAVLLQFAAAVLVIALGRAVLSKQVLGMAVFVLLLMTLQQVVTSGGVVSDGVPSGSAIAGAVAVAVAGMTFTGVAAVLTFLRWKSRLSFGRLGAPSEVLRQSEETFRNLTEGSLQGILVTRNGKPVFANQSYARMYGFDSPDEVVALESGMGLIAPEDRDRVVGYRHDRLAGKETPSEYEFVGLTKNGERIHIRTAVRMVNWFGERALQNTNIDITDLKRAQAEMERLRDRAERANLAKSEFLAQMSHELRTPLNAIIGFSEVLENAERLNIAQEKLTDYAHDIHASAHHLLDLINDVLDVVTMESGKRRFNLEVLDLDAIVGDCITLVESEARRKQIDLTAAVSEYLPELVADERSVRQILINLLANAVKFTRPEGHVAVTVEGDGDAVVLTVTDDGIGMAQEEIGRLMQPFERGWSDPYVSEEGTGLGLAIVQGLVSAHGGNLRISSEVGKRTEVSVRLPLRRNRFLQSVLEGEGERLIA